METCGSTKNAIVEIFEMGIRFKPSLKSLMAFLEENPNKVAVKTFVRENMELCRDFLKFCCQIKAVKKTKEIILGTTTTPRTMTIKVAFHGDKDEIAKCINHTATREWARVINNLINCDKSEGALLEILSFNFLTKQGKAPIALKQDKSKKTAKTQESLSTDPNHPMKALEKKAEETAERVTKKTKKETAEKKAEKKAEEKAEETAERVKKKTKKETAGNKPLRPVPAKKSGSKNPATSEATVFKQWTQAEMDAIGDGYDDVKSDEAVESDEANESDESDKANESDESDKVNESDESDKANESDESDKANESDGSGEDVESDGSVEVVEPDKDSDNGEDVESDGSGEVVEPDKDSDNGEDSDNGDDDADAESTKEPSPAPQSKEDSDEGGTMAEEESGSDGEDGFVTNKREKKRRREVRKLDRFREEKKQKVESSKKKKQKVESSKKKKQKVERSEKKRKPEFLTEDERLELNRFREKKQKVERSEKKREPDDLTEDESLELNRIKEEKKQKVEADKRRLLHAQVAGSRIDGADNKINRLTKLVNNLANNAVRAGTAAVYGARLTAARLASVELGAERAEAKIKDTRSSLDETNKVVTQVVKTLFVPSFTTHMAITDSGTQPGPDPMTTDPEEMVVSPHHPPMTMSEWNAKITAIKARHGFE